VNDLTDDLARDDLTALRTLGRELAGDDVEPPAWLRLRTLAHGGDPTAVAPPHRRRRRGPVLLAAAAAVAAGLIVVPALVPGGDTPLAPDPAAAAVLERAAGTALAQPALTFPPGSYLFREEVVHAYRYADGEGNPRSTFGPRDWWEGEVRTWSPAHAGAARSYLRQEREAPTRAWATAVSFPTTTGSVAGGLPTDAAEMREWLYRHRDGGNPPDAEAFVTADELLQQGYVPPAAQAALFRALARIPGVTVRAAQRDALGRPAVAVGTGAGGAFNALLFDPVDSAYLGRILVLDRGTPWAPPGTVQASTALRRVGVVGHAGDLP
jgi:hypothetical protein